MPDRLKESLEIQGTVQAGLSDRSLAIITTAMQYAARLRTDQSQPQTQLDPFFQGAGADIYRSLYFMHDQLYKSAESLESRSTPYKHVAWLLMATDRLGLLMWLTQCQSVLVRPPLVMLPHEEDIQSIPVVYLQVLQGCLATYCY